MKTLHRRLHKPAPASAIVAGITLGIFSAVLLGGVSVEAVSTNYIWNVSSDVYTNDVNWIAQTNGVTIGNAAPCGNAPISLAAGGSVNYFALVTNGGAISYGDGGGGSSGPYSWTNVLGQLTIGGAANGAVTMSSGSLIVSNAGANDFMIGGATNPTTASFTLNGGSLTATRVAASFFQDFLIVGNALNTTANLTINGGVLTSLGGIEVGNGGFGTVTVNGGNLVDNGWFGIGRGGATASSSAAFNLSAGNVYIMRNAGNDGSGNDNGVYVGQGSSNSTVNVSGGSVYAIRFAGMGGGGAASVQTLNMSGGTIYVGYLGVGTNGTGKEFATISGGTFHTLDMLTNTIANLGNTNTAIFADGTNWTWGANPQVTLTNSSFLVNGVSGPGSVTFAPEANRTITLNNRWVGVGGLVINGPGTIALGAANTYTGGTTISQGNLTLNTGGSIVDSTLAVPSGSTVTLNTTATVSVTNIVTGAGNIVFANTGVINVGSNLQNTGTISQNNGILVVNGSILNAAVLTNNSPATVGPLIAQGTIMSPIGIGPNSAIELGTTAIPGTLNASNVTINGTWDLKINTANTPGSGVNDLLVCKNLTLGANSILNVLPLTLPNGSYVIAQYSGTLVTNIGSGFNSVTDPTRTGTYSVSFATPGEVILNVSSVTAAGLTWASPLIGGSNQWDVGISTNWLNAGSLDMFHQQDAVTFSNTPSPTLTNRVVLVTNVFPSSVTISGGLPYIFSGTGHISGGTGITYSDTNTSGFFTFNNDFTGPVNITAGVFQLGSGGSSWFGSTNGATTINGGTLDLDAQSVGAEPLIIQGTGSSTTGTNTGAINNFSSTATSQSGGPLNVTLAGDTTINASGARWDIGLATFGAGGGSFTGNGFNLTKMGNNDIWMHEIPADLGLGNITIAQGTLGFEFTIGGLGDSTKTITVAPGATFGMWQVTNTLAGSLNKQVSLTSATFYSDGSTASTSNNFAGPIALTGTNTIKINRPLNLAGVISGTGGFQITGTAPLYLDGVDTYSGSTFLGANSHLILNTGASIANTPLIYMTPSTNVILDAGTNTLTLSSGQTLVGAGSITATNFVAGTGTTISPGTNLSFGTIVFTNNLTLNGNTNNFKITDPNVPPLQNDYYQVNGNLNLSGVSTINVTPLVGLQPTPYAIMQVNGTITGTPANLHVVSLSPRYTMAVQINAPYVEIVPTGIPASLVWKGNVSSLWDYGTANWFNLGTSQSDSFFVGDNPIFDDSSSVNTVTITNGILPSGIFMSNVVKSYTFNGAGIQNGTLNMEGNGNGQGGSLTLAMTNAPNFSAIDSSAGTLVYNLSGVTNYFVAGAISDNFGNGNGTVIFGGSNIAVLEGNNAFDTAGDAPGFRGTMLVTNGVLQYTNVFCLGADGRINGSPFFSPLIITNNGTLDFNGVPVGVANAAPIGGLKWIHISGAGFNGSGALTDSKGNQEPNGAFCNLYMDGDAMISLPGTRCDQHVVTTFPGQQVMGNGFNLTLKGGGALFFNAQSDGDTHFGNIDIGTTNGGRLAFQGGPLALGLTDHYLFLETNATVTFFSVTNPIDTVHNGVDKILWMKGSAVLDTGGSSNNYVGPVFLTGTNLFGLRSDMHIWNTIMDTNGPGGFIMALSPVNTGNGNLWLDGANSYSGATILSNNTVHVGASSSLGLSTYVQVNSGATLDLSAMSAFNFGTVATNQSLKGNGTIVGPAAGSVNINAGGTLAPGLPGANFAINTNTSTLTISNSLVFNSGSTYFVGVNKTTATAVTNASDHVAGLTSVTMGGTLVITNYGRSFVGGDVIPLFSSTTYNPNGFTSNNIVPATPGPNLAWDTSTLGTDGNLRIFSTLVINPNPTNIVVSVSGNQLTLSWPTDHIGWTLQSETNNLSVGLTNNWATVTGSTTTNAVVVPINLTNGTVFFRLIYANP